MTFRTLCGPAEVRGLGWVYVPSRGGQIYRAMPRMSRLFLGPVFEEYLRALPSAGREHPSPRPALPQQRLLTREDRDGQGNRACVTRVAAPGTGGLWCSRHAERPALLLFGIPIRSLYLPETARAADRLPAECPASRCDGQRILQIGRAFLRGGVSTRQRNRPSPRPTPSPQFAKCLWQAQLMC